MSTSHSTLDYLKKLVAFDTTSRNSNLELIEFVQSELEASGVRCELTFDSEGRKANLFATLGESTQPGIVLSGHTDVVPVDGQPWSFDPFKVVERDGRIYGRGTCDMKGFIAICLSKVEEILAAELPIPVHFAFSYDEEIGCLGVRELLKALSQQPVQPRACIIGEPTSMNLVRAHKGMFFQRCCVKGKSAHSSLVNQGVNAVTAAARTISHIDDIAKRIQREGPFDDEFDPPYTTLHCGVIHGGTVNNIIPNECQFDFEIRNLPNQPALPLFAEVKAYADNTLLPEMRTVSKDAAIDWQTLAEFPGLDTAADHQLIREISTLLGPDTPRPGKVSYGTEAGLFHEAGIATIICGPGSIEQAHKPDEFIETTQLARGEQFVSALIASLKPS